MKNKMAERFLAEISENGDLYAVEENGRRIAQLKPSTDPKFPHTKGYRYFFLLICVSVFSLKWLMVHIYKALFLNSKISPYTKLNLSYDSRQPAVSALKAPSQGNLSNNFAGQCNL